MHVQPFKARNETREKSASESVWPPEWLRDNCRASDFRHLAQELGPQQLPGTIQKGRKESFVFAFASLCGLHGPSLRWTAGLENYSMVPRTAFSEGLLEYKTLRRRKSSGTPDSHANHEKAVAYEDVLLQV